MKKRKSWREKLADAKDLPKVVAIPPGMQPQWGTGTVVIPAPVEVDQIMRRVPKGKLITINGIRESLAGAAEEDEAEDKKRITPYWRTLKSGGELNPKYPGGIEGQRAKLEAEGHTVFGRGKRYFVQDYERSKVKI
jgi:alkylated DNA nucleotide flippase Atl1